MESTIRSRERDSMKGLISIGVCGVRAVLIKAWPEAKGPDDPWGCEIEAVGSSLIDEMGLALPSDDNIAGLWVWEGTVYYNGCLDAIPVWRGTWRRATAADIAEALKVTVNLCCDACAFVDGDTWAERLDALYEKHEDCWDCQGTGIGNPHAQTPCPACSGRGYLLLKEYK